MKKFIGIVSVVLSFVFLFVGCNNSGYIDDIKNMTKPTDLNENITEYVPEFVTFEYDDNGNIIYTQGEADAPSSEETSSDSADNGSGVVTESVEIAKHQKVRFTMKDGGSFVIELYPEYAPETCANFVKLVNEGFYDGLTFHRIIRGFMAQGGENTDKAPESIRGEFKANGFDANVIAHTRGVVSMARTNDPDSASSQFFICYDHAPHLDGAYAAFGLVVEGMEVVDDFLKVERTLGNDRELSKPVTPIVIEKAEVIG